MPDAIVIAGPNGSGKSTIFPALQNVTREDWTFEPVRISNECFVNADNVAREERVNEMEAGRRVLIQLDNHVNDGNSFAFETVGASRGLARQLTTLRENNYRVYLPYVWLETPELNLLRVAQRAFLGGHYVPLATVRRRYLDSIRNFFLKLRRLADFWVVIDNSRLDFRVVGWGGRVFGDPTTVFTQTPEAVQDFLRAYDSAREEAARCGVSVDPLPSLNVDTERVIPLTPKILEKIRTAIMNEVKSRPRPNCVVISERGKIRFLRSEDIQ